jgi:glycerol kinase
MLPKIVDSFEPVAAITSGPLAGVKICSILGDQQSSAYAHELKLHEAKITYGTGCFLLANIGNSPIIHPSFVTTIMFRHRGEIQYGFECSVECGGGTLNWARRAGFFNHYSELNSWEDVSKESLYFFPSFGEVYAPFWKTGVQGGLVGLNLSTSRSQIVAALLESILFRVKDNLKDESFSQVKRIYADGGMTVNTALMQTQADLLAKTLVVRERDTCWGVAKGVLTALGKEGEGFKDQKVHVFAPR